MAVAFDGTRWADADADPDAAAGEGGDWTGVPTAGGNALEPDMVYQRTAGTAGSISYKGAKNAESGICFVATNSKDMSGTERVIISKVIIANPSVLYTTPHTTPGGAKLEIGSGGKRNATGYYQYYVAYGLGTTPEYPAKGGWLLLATDVNLAGYVDNQGSANPPAKNAINYVGFVASWTTSAKAENIASDAIDFITSGKGLTWTGASGTFASFVTADEGTFANRWGIVSTREAIIYCLAVLTIGSATATTFSDINKIIVWPWQRVGTGAQGLYHDLQNASTVISYTTCSFKGNGYACYKQFFDTTLEVSSANDQVTFGTAHGFTTGDYILYSKEGGAHAIGLTDATYYWVNVVSTTVVSFHTTRALAISGASKVNLTAGAAPGENHSILRSPDNRIDFTVSGTAGSILLTSCVLDGVRVCTLTSKATLSSGFIQNTGNIVLSTAVLTGVTLQSPTLAEGVALCDPVTSITNVTGCIFNAGSEGHAMRLTGTGAYVSDNQYNNYWNPTANGWNFHTQTGVDAGTDVITTNAAHGFTDGDAVYYNKEGGADNVGLTNAAKYYVHVLSTTTFSLHVTKAAALANSSKIDLSDGAAGQTHSIYSSKATIFNDSAGVVTIGCTAGSDTPSIRNGTGASTTVTNSVNLTVTVVSEDNDPVFDADVAIYKTSDSTQLMRELTVNSAGAAIATESYNYTGSTPITVRIRKSSTQNRYLFYDGEVATVTPGDAIHGDNSGATAVVASVVDWGTTGVLFLENIVGAFTDNDPIDKTAGDVALCVANGTMGTEWVAYDNEAGGPFVAGNTVTGGTSTATGTIRGVQDDGATGKLCVEMSTTNLNDFVDNDVLTSGGTTGDANGAGSSRKRYFPLNTTGTITSSGFSLTAVLIEDTIASST